MAPWTDPADLHAQLLRLWERDVLLDATFPLRLVLRRPGSTDMSEHFDAVRQWAAALQAGAAGGYRIATREVRHRVVGRNELPDQAWVDSLEQALRMIGKSREARRLRDMQQATATQTPELLPWLRQHPRRALALADDWPHLLSVVAWLQRHPRPGIYLRQVDLQGVHGKFMETHRSVLGELLDLALPPEAVDPAASGAARFARRYGFREKPLRLRVRFLDPDKDAGWIPGADDTDYGLTQDAFARLMPAAQRVFITENEVNYLAFPLLPDSMLVFGAGYGFDMLARAAWLHGRSVYYWGDIDTHGFAILDQLRATLPHAQSLLMDRATLLEHEALWTDEPQATQRDLTRLTDEERRLYDDLRWRRLRASTIRLEQERVGYGWMLRMLQPLVPGGHQLVAGSGIAGSGAQGSSQVHNNQDPEH